MANYSASSIINYSVLFLFRPFSFCGDRLCDGACQNSTLCYEHRGIEAVKSSNESGLVYNTFAQSFNALKWEGCAQEAQKCCLEQLATSMANNLGRFLN